MLSRRCNGKREDELSYVPRIPHSLNHRGQDTKTRLDEFLRRRQLAVFLVLLAVALTTAWLNRFVQDDAFISFVYARSLVAGHGLAWFGKRVEGYSNFLWVLWIALGLKLGVEPVRWSHFGGMLSFLGAVYGTWRLASLLFRESLAALLAVLLLVANYTFLAYATGGLEAMLQSALVCLAMLQLHRIAQRKAGIARPFLLSWHIQGTHYLSAWAHSGDTLPICLDFDSSSMVR